MKQVLIVCALISLGALGCKKKGETKEAEPAMSAPVAPAVPAAAPAPAPVPVAAGMLGIPECDDLIKRYAACDKFPESAKKAFSDGVDKWKQTLSAGGEAAKAPMVEQCKQAAAALESSIKAVGC
jgi:hypothetical protein